MSRGATSLPQDLLAREKINRHMKELAERAPTSVAAHATLFHQIDSGRPVIPARHHQVWCQMMEDIERYRWVVVICPPGYAKALSENTPILTTDGWKCHGDLAVGDSVFAPDGCPVRVLGSRSWGHRPAYRVTFSDGSSIVADEKHEWEVWADREKYREGRRGKHARCREILETVDLMNGMRRPAAIRVPDPLDIPDRELPVDPYTLGVWLGDGHTADGRITAGDRDAELVAAQIGASVRPIPGRANHLVVKGLTSDLRAAGVLGDKHIPVAYMLASYAQRLALLQGLMDSDGTISDIGQCVFCSTSESLARSARSLVASLGMKASLISGPAMLSGQRCGTAWRVLFHATASTPCFRLPRKCAKLVEAVSDRTRTRYVVSVERTADTPTNCIMVEGGMYLAGDQLVPTHNSTWWSIIYPSWVIGRTGGKVRIGLVSNTANLTYGFSRTIMKTISDPKFEQVYGVRPDYTKWSQKQFWVENAVDKANATLMATGIGGPIQGKRYDLIIGDDLTTWEDARSDMVMEGQRLFLKGLLIKRFPPGMGPPHGNGRMVIAMTRWSERDLVPTFEELGFKVLTMPALGYWDRKATCRDCGKDRLADEFALQNPCEHCGSLGHPEIEIGEDPLWPIQESKEQLIQEREDEPIIFELVKQGNPRVMGGDVFDTSKLQYSKMPEKESFAEIVQYVDTAGGKERTKGDYFAQVTLGIKHTEQGETQVWILDIDRGRYPATQQEKRVSINAALWDPILVIVEEKNEGIALFQRLCETTRLPVRAYVPIRDKEWRAIQIANAVNASRVFLPKNEDGTSPAWVRSFVAELDSFPRGPNDDQVDAAAGAYLHTGGVGPKLRVLTTPTGGGRRTW